MGRTTNGPPPPEQLTDLLERSVARRRGSVCPNDELTDELTDRVMGALERQALGGPSPDELARIMRDSQLEGIVRDLIENVSVGLAHAIYNAGLKVGREQGPDR